MEKKWRCTVCGYIHTGENPPEICPVCGVDSTFFELVTEEKDVAAPTSGVVAPKPETSQLDKPAAIRQALYRISYGLFIITAQADGKDNGQCANTCFQITSEPARLAIGINKQNYTHELIQKSGKFGVSVLSQTGQDYARGFGYRTGRDVNKFEGVAVHRGESGVLLLDDVLVTMEATVTGQLDAGTHTLFLGDVTAGEILQEGDPMTYAFFRASK
ncbi:flavin reductase family protein [Desulfosporosinus hippei]|uniref:NADH-FMN oxidoreductase RutF, flavin reductase (DIM6/NTAB) family n=1 Tax=Desulfosporosinus hippei DSM 8344 TaxID=1121419 RepID=A0A1G8JD74_9FIRM|nr:flavin reductase [Desulfosporosinus hippei]SDI29208.1 NADH-FMN oxidoreductase RutF, flavin reductase (DIM6/NTAB) family [Desulfosporosinus hippei DSM 8344]